MALSLKPQCEAGVLARRQKGDGQHSKRTLFWWWWGNDSCVVSEPNGVSIRDTVR